VCKTLRLVRKLKSCRAFTGSVAMPAHIMATTIHFTANPGLLFLTDELTNDRYFVETGAKLSIIQCAQVPAHLVRFSREQMGYVSPLGDSSQKTKSSKANFLLSVFCKQPLLVPFWALIS
jgi:hypothetical protein